MGTDEIEVQMCMYIINIYIYYILYILCLYIYICIIHLYELWIDLISFGFRFDSIWISFD